MKNKNVMKKNNIEFLGVMVKINGKKKFIKKEQLYFRGWEYNDECSSDSGVDLQISDKKGTTIAKLNL
jgi:hypothetical protein